MLTIHEWHSKKQCFEAVVQASSQVWWPMMIRVSRLHVDRVSQTNILFRIQLTFLQEGREGREAVLLSLAKS
jgi:hypothetical protein